MNPPVRKPVRPGARFVITAAILSVSLFGILRIPFVEQNLLLPFTKAQHGLACRIGGDPTAPISVGLSCSAADVIALCLGFVLAFPVAWGKRLLGAAMGLVLIAGVNTVRIATLSIAVKNRPWFDLLHVYIWPGVLLVVVSVFVFLWMSYSLRGTTKRTDARGQGRLLSRPGVRFVLLTLFFVALFIGTSSWWMHSPAVLKVAGWVASTGAFVIRLFGGNAEVTRHFLRTTSGSFVVTQECIMSPLIPAYFAAVVAFSHNWKQRSLGLLAAFPVFFALGAARLLVLAFPTRMVGSHLVAIHGFSQMVLGALLIVAVAILSSSKPRSTRSWIRPSLAGLLAGAVTAVAVGLTYNRLVFWLIEQLQALVGHAGHQYLDPQAALLMMVPYQLGLFVGFWVAWAPKIPWRRGLIGLGLLLGTQVLVLVLVGEGVSHTGMAPHVAAIRAWSVIHLLIIAGWVVRRPRRIIRSYSPSPAEPQHG